MDSVIAQYITLKNSEEEIDTTIHSEPRTKTVRTVVDSVIINKYFGQDDDLIVVNNTSNTGSHVYDIESYGRECILIEFGDDYYINRGYILNVRMNVHIYGSVSNGDPRRMVEFAEWLATDFTNNYYGDDQGIRNNLHDTFNYGMRFGSGYFAFPEVQGAHGVKAILSTNVPIFETQEDVENYIYTGNYDNAINPFISDELIKVWYYDYRISDFDESTHKLLNTVENKKEFKLKKSSDKVRFVKDDENSAHLQFNCDSVLLKNGTTYTDTPIDDSFVYTVYLNKAVGGKYGDLYTNIPIVGDFDDPIDTSDNFTNENDPNFTGEDSSMDNTTIVGVTSPLGCYYITSRELETIKDWLFTTDHNVFDTMKTYLWQFNENPADCVVSLMYVPFSISNYCLTVSKHLQFGSLIFDGSVESIPNISYSNIISSFGKVTHVNTRIIPTYNDFRDYDTITYSVYMPYYGILELDSSCVGQTLRIVSYFNAWTVQLTYYVYIGSALVGEYTCDVGQQISITGNNWMTKSRQNFSDMMGVYGGATSSIDSFARLNLGGVVGGVSESVNSAMNLLSKPTTMTKGVNSGGMNIYDDMNFYLIVESYETVKPLNLNTEYGTPCYMISLLNRFSGFVMADDVKLETGATKEERDEIINLIKMGIII